MSDPKPQILIIDDDPQTTAALVGVLSRAGFAMRAATDLNKARRHLDRELPALILLSELSGDGLEALSLVHKITPHVPIVYLSEQTAVDHAVQVMRAGAADLVTSPVEAEYLIDTLQRHIDAHGKHGFIAVDASSRKLLAMARKVADSEVSVLISGESGTGKEVLARYIHAQSSRRTAPFVAINCAAIPENMLEAMLFGHEKGAFTGAAETREGKFEQANGGTLLLDEISEMPLALQAKLLRVIQEREVERIGGKNMISLDVRIVATTNRDIADAVKQGDFREDLYYRLNVFPLHLLPLRHRRDDILPITEFLLRKHAPFRAEINNEARRTLLDHDWPGNVRELENVLQRSLVLSEQTMLTREDMHIEAPGQLVAEDAAEAAEAGLGSQVKNRESDLILNALKANDGSRKRAAEQLGISPRTLRYKLARMRDEGISIPA